MGEIGRVQGEGGPRVSIIIFGFRYTPALDGVRTTQFPIVGITKYL